MKSVRLKQFFAAAVLVFTTLLLNGQGRSGEYYELRIYNYQGDSSEMRLDNYLRNALVPGLHRAGISRVGVFKTSPADTSTTRKFYVLIPYRALADIERIEGKLQNDKNYISAGADYINAAHNNAPYQRMEKTILKSFEGMPHAKKTGLKGDPNSLVYELRSYEGATEKLYKSKVKMFNVGDEIAIFDRLGFNAIFYAEVLAGKSMPNLMYMISFENMDSRNEHWKAFGSDPAWKKLLTDKQYDNTVSHIDSWFLYPAEYSDL